ncbi:MAG: type II toxin-antitoxin system VapC family toxin [Acidimicrobiia bacterium]|nr:type II toxin-antitoxin system VapC family toxin [Acidimicrobiia bacterium]MYC57530.1 type II toxin-antitoxin system VapC family toxin [Acidimicrobiia bacterium]MYI30106.1 type II toxin-antitoxin system VapC family toxin [Acidimicrobiia bacterium]
MNTVLDTSAILAFVQDEDGSTAVEEALLNGAVCGAANWSEVAQKVLAADRDWDLVRALLLSYEVHIEPVTADDAEWAALRWQTGERLSLADRLCMALATRLDSDVLTADTTWGSTDQISQIR